MTGFGWFVDNLWPVSIGVYHGPLSFPLIKPADAQWLNAGLILTPVTTEFGFRGPFLPLSQNIGLFCGAIIFGLGSDIWGRRISFNTTLLIVGVFATAAAGSPDYQLLCTFAAIWSIGVGGNLPVDSAIFIEYLPGSHQYLLTVLSIWWA